MKKNDYGGVLIAFDGPNGVGKSTLIDGVKSELLDHSLSVFITKEPTETPLGRFVREISESLNGEELACLVAADRYQHLKADIIPELGKDKIVITDRYVLSSLILQCMDGGEDDFVLAVNGKVVLPDIQISVRASVEAIQARLNERNALTRFERGQRSTDELSFMGKGEAALRELGVSILSVDNSGNLQGNISLIVDEILRAKS